MGGMELPSLEKAREALVPRIISEEEFREEVAEIRSKNPGAPDGVIALMLANMHGLSPYTLEPVSRMVKEVSCIQEAEPGNGCSIIAGVVSVRKKQGSNGDTRLIISAVDSDFCSFTIFDWESRIDGQIEENQMYYFEDAFCRSDKYGRRILSIGRYTKVNRLNGASFNLPPVKAIEDIRDYEFVRVKCDALFGSLRVTRSGTVRLVVLDGKRWVNVVIYPSVVDKLRATTLNGVELEELDRWHLEIVGRYVKEETPTERSIRAKGYADRNTIYAEIVRPLEKIYDDEMWGDGAADEREVQQPLAAAPAQPSVDLQKVKESLELIFSVHSQWDADELLSLLTKKFDNNENAARQALAECERAGLLKREGNAYSFVGGTPMMPPPEQQAPAQQRVDKAPLIGGDILRIISEYEKSYGDGATADEIYDELKKRHPGILEEDVLEALSVMVEEGKVHQFSGGKYRRI